MIELLYLGGADVDALSVTDDEILGSVRGVIAAQGLGETVIEPRTHLFPQGVEGHFNVLRGVTGDHAGVKVVGDFVHNHRLGLPSELAMLLLMDPATGVPVAIIDATAITEMRTGAVTAIGGEYLARRDARVLGHIGARGTAYWNVRLLCHLFPGLEEVRVHSLRPESREQFARRLRDDLGREVHAVASWEECVRGADIVVEASRLTAPAPLLKTEWIQRGALVMPYGTVSAVERGLLEIMDKIVVDDWGQAHAGPLGALRVHVDSGRLSEDNLYGELGSIVAGSLAGRERDDETILFWHRGLSLSDIALGSSLLRKAKAKSIGQTLRFE